MADSLIGKSELPPVSILQMILEGPKGYFGRRGQESDLLWMQGQQQRQQGQFAQGLINTPEWKTAMTNPYDRMSQGGLWALTQGGPGNMPTQGGNWLQTAISGAYGREQATFEDQLQKSRITMTTDEALRLEQGKLDLQTKYLQSQMQQVFGNDENGVPKQQSQFVRDQQYNMIADKTGMQKLPDGFSIGQNAAGQPAFVPTPGGKPWQEMTQKLSPLQMMNGAIDELQDLDASGSNDTGRRQQLVAIVQDSIRQGNAMGTLDAGAMQQMGKYISEYGSYTGYGANPVGSKNYATAQEKLRGLKITTQQKITDWSRQYMVDPGRVGDPYAYTRAAEKVPKPSETADEAVKKLQPPEKPNPTTGGWRTANPSAPSPWNFGAGQDTGMSSRGRGGR